LTHDYLKKENIDFNILQPLIQNTVDKLLLGNPSEMQTGPAVRGDQETINSHLELLAQYPQLKGIYQDVSNSILEYYKSK
jgi:hypothetical protein